MPTASLPALALVVFYGLALTACGADDHAKKADTRTKPVGGAGNVTAASDATAAGSGNGAGKSGDDSNLPGTDGADGTDDGDTVDGNGNDDGTDSGDGVDPAAARAFFTDTVAKAFQAQCATCHADPRIPADPRGPLTIFSYDQMHTKLADGTSATANALYAKVSNTTTHGGGNRCTDGDDSPCALISQWWQLEHPAAAGADDDTTDGTSPVKGTVSDVTSLGKVYGWAADTADTTAALAVTLYLDAPAGAGVPSTSGTANFDGADNLTPGAHGFALTIPDAWRDRKPHKLYAYATAATAAAAPTLLTPTGVAFTAYAPTTAGKAFFDANVKPKLTSACGSCHVISYEQQFYAMLDPAPSDGGTATTNTLIKKPAQSGVSHGGGQRCSSLAAEPCATIQAFWNAEFAP